MSPVGGMRSRHGRRCSGASTWARSCGGPGSIARNHARSCSVSRRVRCAAERPARASPARWRVSGSRASMRRRVHGIVALIGPCSTSTPLILVVSSPSPMTAGPAIGLKVGGRRRDRYRSNHADTNRAFFVLACCGGIRDACASHVTDELLLRGRPPKCANRSGWARHLSGQDEWWHFDAVRSSLVAGFRHDRAK
jgi:hypothetical protein